jgi:hypothetical protein
MSGVLLDSRQHLDDAESVAAGKEKDLSGRS